MHFVFSSKSADPTNFVFNFWHLGGQMDRQYSLSTRLTWPVFCSVSTALLTCREIKGFILLKTSNFFLKKPTLLYKYEIDNMAKNYQYFCSDICLSSHIWEASKNLIPVPWFFLTFFEITDILMTIFCNPYFYLIHL